MILDLVVRRKKGWGPPRCSTVEVVPSTGEPFRRCNYGCSRVAPIPYRPSFGLYVSTKGWGIVVWQCSEIWTITAFSLLKYTFVTITSLPFALRRRVPGRTSLISIPPGGWGLLLGARPKSVQPEMHVCDEEGCSSGNVLLSAVGRAAFSFWIWSGLICMYLSVSCI